MVGKEMCVQVRDGPPNVALVDDEADVDFGSSLGNHAHIHASRCYCVEHASRDSRLAVNFVAHQAHDGVLVFAADVGDPFEVYQECLRKALGFYGERQTYLGDGNDVHGSRMGGERLE